jgi:hypothetical protein
VETLAEMNQRNNEFCGKQKLLLDQFGSDPTTFHIVIGAIQDGKSDDYSVQAPTGLW